MANYTNFIVGEKFPLPIRHQQDGAMFQIDVNGMMFILQLSRHDVIAAEAFRTGKMTFALYEEDDVLFLLYQIDGIFKDGWGDAPFSLAALKEAQHPTDKSLADACLHLYFVDTTLQSLLAMRDIPLSDAFLQVIREHLERERRHPLTEAEYVKRVKAIWARRTSEAMRKNALAVQEVPMTLTKRAHA